jgi:peptide deformylase
MIQRIIQSGEKKLREISKPVAKIDKKVKKLVADLKDTLEIQKDPEGVGLAAPQIAQNQRVFVTKYKDFERVVINPEIIDIKKIKESKKRKKHNHDNEILEGCLSLPHYYGPLKRAASVKLKYQDESGNTVEEEFKGFNAQIILHEMDHLDGVLFVDRLLEQKQKLYKLDENDEWEEVEL